MRSVNATTSAVTTASTNSIPSPSITLRAPFPPSSNHLDNSSGTILRCRQPMASSQSNPPSGDDCNNHDFNESSLSESNDEMFTDYPIVLGVGLGVGILILVVVCIGACWIYRRRPRPRRFRGFRLVNNEMEIQDPPNVAGIGFCNLSRSITNLCP